ncbi:vWA domain-containing protein [Actinosynnema pretiosum]|uniref:VWFA domain-containing protein n=1 Tax=Actinosynnema pretiosum TaxID=42197 RepID=A0A290Z112_9PSEU|nr:VWA domain-containing protein [Actinosynnema pretiosum]ATE52675.1 hypothetical protein CNX65_04745 [Actinosynnema pretiosum]
MEADKLKLLPFYLVIDVSLSMTGNKLDQANAIMPKVLDALMDSPILADKVRFGVIDFSDDAQVRLPLCDLLDDSVTLPKLTVRGTTSYAAALRLLRAEIESNVKQLKADGFMVHRPAVFFVSDGETTDREDEWRSALHDLTQGFAAYPNLIPCGVDEAEPKTLAALIHPASGNKAMQMYLMTPGYDPGDAIAGIAEILISSVISSGQSMAQGDSGLMLPDRAGLPEGISAHDAGDWL